MQLLLPPSPAGWASPAHTTLAGDRRDCEWRRMSAHLISAICRSTRDCDGCPLADRVTGLGCPGAKRHIADSGAATMRIKILKLERSVRPVPPVEGTPRSHSGRDYGMGPVTKLSPLTRPWELGGPSRHLVPASNVASDERANLRVRLPRSEVPPSSSRRRKE